MRQLLLLRHAEAAAHDGDDFDRPLTQAGIEAMNRLRATITQYDPDLILCSPARRTRQTLQTIMPDHAGRPVLYEEKIYDATTGGLYETVKALDAAKSRVLLVGHNPAIHGVALFLAEEGDDERSNALRRGYNPGTLAVLEFSKSWNEIEPDSGRLCALSIPR